ncbi:MAG: hypothetical protein AAF702_43325 [Chloroflexota bacterium]
MIAVAVYSIYMIRLVETDAPNRWIQHLTWTRIGDTEFRLSPLQNQFALAEIDPPVSESAAIRAYRGWLWEEMQDEQNVVWREMCELVSACEQGQPVEIMTPKGTKHGEVIVSALGWMQNQTREVEIPRIISTEPSPCYEPILPDGTITLPSPIDPKHLVWIHGNHQSRIGVISEWEVAFVPEYGEVPLKPGQFHWMNRRLAESPQFQATLSDALDAVFEEEADQSPPEYEPAPPYLYRNRQDPDEDFEEIQDMEKHQQGFLLQAGFDTLSSTLVDDLLQETDDVAVAAIVQIEDTPHYHRRPPNMLSVLSREHVRPAYLHRGKDSPLRIKTALAQIEGMDWRDVTKEEVEEYIATFRSKPATKETAKILPRIPFRNTLPAHVRRACARSPYSGVRSLCSF